MTEYALTNIILHAGKYNSPKDIDVVQRVSSLGKNKSHGLIGFHNFTGSDYGGKFVGISKKSWCKFYFTLDDDDFILNSFDALGSLSPHQCCLDANGEFTDLVKPLETFTCLAYDPEGPSTLPDSRFNLWNTKNCEAENLPPCRATLAPHIQRTNFVCMLYKSYHYTHPDLPDLLENGWTRDKKTEALLPDNCLNPPCSLDILRDG